MGLHANRPTSDKEYQAMDDARTLAEAKNIKGDMSRLKPAIAQAKKMKDDFQERARAISAVANMKANAASKAKKKK